MSSEWPETRDELIARFCEPNHNGHIMIEDREQFEKFVDEALSRPDPSYSYAFHDNPEKQPLMTVSALCSRIYDHGFFINPYSGWIDRDGFFWRCGFASHERLLELMGMNSIEQEYEGWLKISKFKVHGRFFPNEAQSATLLKISDELQEDQAITLYLGNLAELKPWKEKRS